MNGGGWAEGTMLRLFTGWHCILPECFIPDSAPIQILSTAPQLNFDLIMKNLLPPLSSFISPSSTTVGTTGFGDYLGS